VTDEAREHRRRIKAEFAFHVLGKHKGNPKAAAKALGISVTTLTRRVTDYCEIHGYATTFDAAYHSKPENLDEIVQSGAG
jgi:DNA-binding NtrC family response regulator